MNNTNEGVDTPNNCTTNFLDSFVSNFLSDCLKSFSDALFELAYDSDNFGLIIQRILNTANLMMSL